MKTANLTFIVEDDQIASFLIRKTLEKNNSFSQILGFENGQPAFDRLKEIIQKQQSLPDLILLDINMPIMDGWEFLEAIRELKAARHLPVIMLTSSINEEDKKKSSAYSNVLGYFTKPLTDQKVLEFLKLLEEKG